MSDIEEPVHKKIQLNIDKNKVLKDWKNPMRKPRITKVVVNFSVGESGEPLQKAKQVLESITGKNAIECRAKESIRSWNVRKGEPIGVRVTLRDQEAFDFIKKVLWANEDFVSYKNWDNEGNLALGIKDHLNLPDTRYDPKLGVHGFGVTAIIERPGFRIKRRKYMRRKVGRHHRLTKDEAVYYYEQEFNIKLIEDYPDRIQY
ncbi:MAG: 50S ribosomal protein L5 [Candidatus Hodarchaeales archaeon]|jgi:large subunit ribosomal protein L5